MLPYATYSMARTGTRTVSISAREIHCLAVRQASLPWTGRRPAPLAPRRLPIRFRPSPWHPQPAPSASRQAQTRSRTPLEPRPLANQASRRAPSDNSHNLAGAAEHLHSGNHRSSAEEPRRLDSRRSSAEEHPRLDNHRSSAEELLRSDNRPSLVGALLSGRLRPSDRRRARLAPRPSANPHSLRASVLRHLDSRRSRRSQEARG